jgi:sterol desaturase/sphingolipid hydroxylase (fatty acid hydroxylase superfamily)
LRRAIEQWRVTTCTSPFCEVKSAKAAARTGRPDIDRTWTQREASAMEHVLLWVLQLLLSDAFVVMCGMFLVAGLLEYIIPAQKIPARHYAFNLVYAFVNIVAIIAFAPLLSAGVAYAIQKLGLGLIDLRALGADGIGGGLFAVLAGTIIFDLFQYWQHRLEHGNQIFWQLHLLHHCDEHMSVTTSTRNHFFENLLAPIFITIPMAILFKLPPVTIAILSLIPSAWIYVSHANINLGFGPLWWLLVSPNYHRIHHSLEARHLDKNFVGWFPVWDIIFGTACAPRRRECPPTGVAGVFVRTLPQAYLLPFRGWMRMISARLHAGFPKPPTTRIRRRA